MKTRSFRHLALLAACAAVVVLGRNTPALAAEQDGARSTDRLERLERRVNEMAQRQEQLMQRLGAQQEQRAPIASPDREGARARQPLRDRPALKALMPPAGAPGLPGAPGFSAPPPQGTKAHKDLAGLLMLCFLVALAFNILVAIWIFTDIRKQGQGSGIFIALALLAGVPAAIIYAIVRIGDKKT